MWPSLNQSLQPQEKSALIGHVWVTCPALDLGVGSATHPHPHGLRKERGDTPKENWGDSTRRKGLAARQLITADAITLDR